MRARISRTLHLSPGPTIDEIARPLALVAHALAEVPQDSKRALDFRGFEARMLALSIFGSVDHETALLFGAGGSLPRDLLDYFEPTARALVMLRAICADMEPTDFEPSNCF